MGKAFQAHPVVRRSRWLDHLANRLSEGPAGTGGGNNGSIIAHSASVRSLGYACDWRRPYETPWVVIKDQP